MSAIGLNPPTNLRVTGQTTSTISLAWDAAIGSISTHNYELFRNGVKITTLPAGILTYSDGGLTPSTSYQYTVRTHAFSAHSNVATGSTLSQYVPQPEPQPQPEPTPGYGLYYQIQGEETTRQYLIVRNETSSAIPAGWNLQFHFTGNTPAAECPATVSQAAGGTFNTVIRDAIPAHSSITIPFGTGTNTSISNVKVNCTATTRL